MNKAAEDFMNSIKKREGIARWITVYLGAVSFIFVPLFMKTGYFNLIFWKSRAYLYAAIPAVIVMAVITGTAFLSKFRHSAEERPGRQRNKVFIKIPQVSLFLLAAIAAWSLFTSYMSQNPELSMMGTAGWSMGSLMIAVLTASTIIVSQYFEFQPYLLLPVMVVNIIINSFAIIQSGRFDLFGLLQNIDKKQVYTYLSTIGQKNSYSGYLCLILPFFWGAFISCKDRLTELLYGIFAVFGFMGIIVAESDSTYAGIGICILFMLLFIFGSEQYVKRSSILLILYGCCLLAVRSLPVFSGKIARFKGISKAMIGKPIAEILCISGFILYFIGWKIIGGKFGKYILIVIELGLLIGIGWYAVNAATHFNDNWGTKRGMIWRVGWERFMAFPLRSKLIGVGPEMLVTVYVEIRAATGRNVVSAHCEPLQVLLTQGIIGLGLYLAYWGYLLKLFFGKKLWRKSTASFFFPLAAYWGQSLFCSVYPVTGVLFSFVSGMYLKAAETRD